MRKFVFPLLMMALTIACGGSDSTPDEVPVAKTLSVSLTTLQFATQSATKSFDVASNGSWRIVAPSWCSVSNVAGTGNATIQVTALKNEGEARSGQIVVSGTDFTASATISVTQEGVPNEPSLDDNLPPS